MSKKILVLLKIYKGDLNPFDECALECALSFPNSEVTCLAMSPLSHLETLENITRLGCDAILVSDKHYAGSDTIATAKVLAKAIKQIKPDLVFAGRQSVDGNTAQVPLMLSEMLNYEIIKKVISVEGNKVTTRTNESFNIDTKQIITFEKFKLLRSPSMFSKKRNVQVVDNSQLKLDENEVGLKGSPTQVIKTYSNESDRRFCSFIDYAKLDEVIKESLNKNNNQKEELINKIPVIHFVGDLEEISKKYAEKTVEIDVNGLTVDEVCSLIKKMDPKVILWEENDKYKELASRVAIKMNLGLCADCVSFNNINGKFVITRPALGGDVIADIVSSSTISMATIKSSTTSNENVAITIGKGAIENIKGIEKLANKFNAKIYCSRPLADSGLIDYSHQVGLTGISISPKVCITIGTSGAVQHIVGINKSQTIIAINLNKKEKIFDYADYGVVMDAKNI
jgi:electron transfer flavoprotein alpha subunit